MEKYTPKPIKERLEFIIYKRELANLLIDGGFDIVRLVINKQTLEHKVAFMFKNTEEIRDAYAKLCLKYQLKRKMKPAEIDEADLFVVDNFSIANDMLKAGFKIRRFLKDPESETRTLFGFEKTENIISEYSRIKNDIQAHKYSNNSVVNNEGKD